MAKFIEIRPDPREIPPIKTLSKDFMPKRTPELASNNYLNQTTHNSYKLFEIQNAKPKQCLSVFSTRIRSGFKRTNLECSRLRDDIGILPHPNTTRAAPYKQNLFAKLDNSYITGIAQTEQNQIKLSHHSIIEPNEILSDVKISLNKPLTYRATKLNPSFLTRFKAITHRKTQSIPIYHSQHSSIKDVHSILPSQTPRIRVFDDRVQNDERSVCMFSPAHSLIKKKPEYISLEKLTPASNFASTCLLPPKKIFKNKKLQEKSLKIEKMNLISQYEDTLKSFDSTSARLDVAVSCNILEPIHQSVSKIESIITVPRDTVLVSRLHI